MSGRKIADAPALAPSGRLLTIPTMPDSAERRAATRRPLPVFVAYLVLLVVGIVIAITIGLVRGADDEAAGETVERFAAALDAQDGRGACDELSANTRGELESREANDCEAAILDLELELGTVADVDVADTTATVELSTGGSVYLEDTSNGWRITAIGCEPRPEEPDDCEVQA